MTLFLQILEGETPSTATPVIATRDRKIIADVARALASRLGADGARVLELAAAPARRRRPVDDAPPADEAGGAK